MSLTLVIDDLFLESGYRYFWRFYEDVYGGEVSGDLSFADFERAVTEHLGTPVGDTHVYCLEDRPSRFLQAHLEGLALTRYRASGGDESVLEVVPSSHRLGFLLEGAGLDLEDLVRVSGGPRLHFCDFTASDSADFAVGCRTPVVLVGDDPVFDMAGLPQTTVFFRLGNEETRMRGRFRWQNVAYLFCAAYGVEA